MCYDKSGLIWDGNPAPALTIEPVLEAQVARFFKSCSVDGCKVSAAHADGGRRGYCNKHYLRLRAHGDPQTILIAERGEPADFIDRLLAQDRWPDECIEWPYGKNGGYGTIKIAGEVGAAHREICRRVHGAPADPAFEVRHLCGNGTEGCVNPSHLAWGTHAENMADLVQHGTKIPARGEKQWKAKLTATDVVAIRKALLFGETQRSIADRFGVTEPSINAIHRRRAWAWLN